MSRAVGLMLTTLATTLLAPGCKDDDCSVLLICPRTANGGSSGGGGEMGGAEPSNSGGSGGAGGEDEVSPTVLSITPAFGNKGILAAEPIVITFSEPMDQTATEAAYTPVELPQEPPLMTWSEDSSVLTINAHLVYPNGPDPANVPEKAHRFSISTQARDIAGNTLASAANHEFWLAREVIQQLTMLEPLSQWRGNVDTAGGLGSFVGAGESSSSALPAAGFVTFDISALPNMAMILELEGAVFRSAVRAIREDPFGLWGDMTWDHVTFATSGDVWATASLDDLGVFIPAVPAPQIDDPVVHDVTQALGEDLTMRVARQNRSQFRLHITDSPDSTPNAPLAHVYNDSANTILEVTYLIE